ncbi:MAG: hypothetical protein ACREPM_21610 [Gemmatimonadaceae bacterium]
MISSGASMVASSVHRSGRGLRACAAALSVATAAFGVACGGGSEATGPQAASSLSIVSGNGQVGLVGQTLAVPLAVGVAASNGAALKGATVTFAVTTGTASITPSSALTDTSGQAKTVVTLGSSPGTDVITATVAGTSLTASFSITAGSSSTSLACSSSSPQAPAAGAVLAGVSGTGICLGGGTTGAEYGLVAFYGDPDSSKIQSLAVTGRGATAVLTADVVPTLDAAVVPSPLVQRAPNTAQDAFDVRLREMARRDLTPLIPAARARRQLGAATAAIPANVTVGTLVTLNAQGIFSCTQAKPRVARVAGVSNTAIVVADTANPKFDGFTDAEYQGFATMFDTLINPLDVQNFGQPSDIDGNGKVIIFFTKEVNALTPKTGAGGVIGGFFFERDLFPLATQNGLDGCAGSNFAEMFYMLVPDSLSVYSISQPKSYVSRVTPGTLAHEYQHLINASRRIYVNNANSFEDTWLNEGLSHVAEELLFYRVSGLLSRSNIGISQLNSQALVNAFNSYQIDNTLRFEVFLDKPNATSVYGGLDSLETRGAAWNLLRYLADHAAGSEVSTWQALVNSTTTGQLNLARVFGGNYMTQIGNWAISVLSDDVAGVSDARYLEQSWNMRSIFPNLVDSNGNRLGSYPLRVFGLSDQSPVSTSVWAGGTAYLKFSVSPGSQASIDWGTTAGLPVSPLMQFTVVRTK